MYMFKTNQPKETMKPIKIEYRSNLNKNNKFHYLAYDMKTAIEICENGIDNGYIVLVNGNKYKSMREFGKTINLNN